MIYLLYGSDTKRSREKLNEIIAGYRKKGGLDLSFYSFDAEEDAPEKIKNVLEAGSLFSVKKVVVLKYLVASSNKKELFATLEKIKDSPDSTVFLWERELSPQELSEAGSYCKKVQEFKIQEARNRVRDASIFRLGDAFFSSPRDGLRVLLGLLYAGHEEFNIFSYLVNQTRTLLMIKHYSDSGKNVPSDSGIHPYVIKKASATARGLLKEELKSSVQYFFEEDFKIKTGVLKPKDSLIRLLAGKLS